MFSLFKASLFKLFREKTFLITMIIGTVLAVVIPLFYRLLDAANGQMMLLLSSVPGNGFGLTVPINLTVLVISEFTVGSLRNKVIAGYSKNKIYLSLLISGIIFTFIMMFYYIGISTLMGTILGGFDINQIGGWEYVGKYLGCAICTYIFIAALSIFFATLVRNIGGTLPIIIILLTFMNLLPLILETSDKVNDIICVWLIPTYATSFYGSLFTILMTDYNFQGTFLAGAILSPLIYSSLLIALGMIIFKNRDIK